MSFPATRLRRLRRTEKLRSLVRETVLAPNDLILPLFVHEHAEKKAISSMPGCFRLSVADAVRECRRAAELGIPGAIIFGVPARKDERGSAACKTKGIVQRAVAAIKGEIPGFAVITDVCLCDYTSHGQCGVLRRGEVDNDETVKLLCKIAVSHAQAGADVVAPSDMMDGRVGAIRSALDSGGHKEVAIMSYAAKYASSFYGPFREAVEITGAQVDRRSHQMDPANSDEALREVELDLQEGADIVMVKPALAYLDVVRRVKDEFRCPVAAYSVSGEYSMIKAAAARSWIDEKRAMLEILTCMRRAGADFILTYFALQAAEILNSKNS